MELEIYDYPVFLSTKLQSSLISREIDCNLCRCLLFSSLPERVTFNPVSIEMPARVEHVVVKQNTLLIFKMTLHYIGAL